MLALVLAPATAAAQARGVPPAPHLRPSGSSTQLIVDGRPFLILGGELGNSTASDLRYLGRFWPLFDSLHLNTVLAPVSWELIEPAEGRFDFASVDGLLRDARLHRKRLVLLWFGSWKNSMSSYVPGWVKRDEARFPRARRSDGTGLEMLTAFSAANRDADARAFAALMTHLRLVDGQRHTVIMVQVENEIGMIPEARDHHPAADSAFAAGVGVSGSGTEGDERFMAYHFARYTEAVAAAGKAAYPLPMFVNAALIRPGRRPGEYPSAGPLPHLADVWRAGAPSIDILAPDIYFPNFVEWFERYRLPGNPLLVPETGRAPDATPANALYAMGLGAIGFSPFAIEQYRGAGRLAQAYDVLAQLTPLILEHAGDSSMVGLCPPVTFDGVVDTLPQTVQLGDVAIRVAFTSPFGPSPDAVQGHAALIIRTGVDEFVVAGRGVTLTFSVPGAIAGIESIWEGRYAGGRWVPGRLLNGDESHQGRHLRIPEDRFGIQRVRLYRYH